MSNAPVRKHTIEKTSVKKPGTRTNVRRKKRILFAASEVYPLVKAGGLADVACYLPIALSESGHDIRVVLPAYRGVLDHAGKLKAYPGRTMSQLNTHFRILETKLPGGNVTVYLVDIPELYDRPGGPYQDQHGLDWPDNALRFAAFCRVIRLLCLGLAGINWVPDILHVNDWHTGLAPALLAADSGRPAAVFTIHNLAYQGDFPYTAFRALSLPDDYWSIDALEFYGRMSFIKGGLVYADRLTTVSPEYAREITTPAYGCGMEGLLTARGERLSGILNGVDYRFWDPRHDPMIGHRYWIPALEGKQLNKQQLQRELALNQDPGAVVLAHVSRLAWQKGIDMIIDSLPELLRNRHIQLVVLGAGERHYERALLAAAQDMGHRMSVRVGYDEAFAHRIQAGADIMLMPSRFEPCGLTQLYSLRYGTVPVVRRTGGLADTIVDANDTTLASNTATGFHFIRSRPADYLAAIHRAVTLFRNYPLKWKQLMHNGMNQDFGWARSAAEYVSVYDKALDDLNTSG
jgi:starch synthase